MISKHRKKELHLLTGMESISEILWLCSSIYPAFLVKYVELIDLKKSGNFLNLLLAGDDFRTMLYDISSCFGTNRIILFQRICQYREILVVFLQDLLYLVDLKF